MLAGATRRAAMAALLDGKVGFVTGGGSGIGRATALAMAREGARVVVVDRDAAAAAATVALMDGQPGLALGGDVTDRNRVRAMIDTAADAFGRIDCAVNNAGVAPYQVGSFLQRTHEWSEDSFDRMIDVNLNSVFQCMKQEIARMLGQGGGAIVNMASIAGLVGLERACGYVASKHGVIGLTRTAALEYAADGIRVNAVCPGFIATRMTVIAREMRGDQLLARTPMGRFGSPEEIAELVVWLCSDRASYVTGVAYAADGGWTAT